MIQMEEAPRRIVWGLSTPDISGAHLFGELSTWQWVQAWLQYSPMLSCSVFASPLTRGDTPRSCRQIE